MDDYKKMHPEISFTAVNPWALISGVLTLFGAAVTFVLSRKDKVEKNKIRREEKAKEDSDALAVNLLRERNREEKRIVEERRDLFDEIKAQLKISIDLSQTQAEKMTEQAMKLLELQFTVSRLEIENAELRKTVEKLTYALEQYTNGKN